MTQIKTRRTSEQNDSIAQMSEAYLTILDETKVDILTPGRKNTRITHQMIFVKYCKHYLGLTFEQIGQFLKKNHATIIHSCKKYDDLHFSDKDFRSLAESLIDKIYTINSKEHSMPMLYACQSFLQKSSEADRARYYAAMIEIRENPGYYQTTSETRAQMLQKYADA
jgi:hypothetical protein